METTQRHIGSRMDKHMLADSQNGAVQLFAIIWMNPIHNGRHKKFISYDSIHIKFKNSQN
jgi:hypothetical protein